MRGCPEWRGRDAQYDFPRSATVSLSFYGERSVALNESWRGLLALQEREQLPLQGCLGSTRHMQCAQVRQDWMFEPLVVGN